jgi:hypothetical protein
MDNIIKWASENWVGIIAIYLAVHKVAVAVRDAIDKTPQTDDTIFEKAVTIMGKIGDYIVKAKRPTA